MRNKPLEGASAYLVAGPAADKPGIEGQVDPHRAAMWLLHGLKPSKRSACPLSVAGKRCRRFRYPRYAGAECLCEKYPSVQDHARAWLDGGVSVLTYEPYHVDPAALAALRAECEALGLTVTAGGASPWYAGSTTLIVVRRGPLTRGGTGAREPLGSVRRPLRTP